MRITLDLDYPSELRLLMAYFNLRHAFGQVELERSPTGAGYHLVARGADREAEQVFRLMLGDDPERVRFDGEAVMKPKRILFQAKWVGGRRHAAERVDERGLLAMPFFSRVPRGWYVCGRRGR